MNKQYQAILVGLILTVVSYGAGLLFGWITEINNLEAFSVFTSYWCTFLCVFQSRWNYPIGAVSVAALCVLFWQQSLFASMTLQVYLFPTLLYGWWYWRDDSDTRPVSTMNFPAWMGYIAVTGVVGIISMSYNTFYGGANPVWDSVILVGSILAQFMLDRKKLENWIIWLVVDIISVYVYWGQDLKILAIQMGLFGLNALWGLYEWYNSYLKRQNLENINLLFDKEIG